MNGRKTKAPGRVSRSLKEKAMKVRSKSSSLRLTIGIQFLLYSARTGSRVGYHSSKEGWPLAGRLANAGFRLILPRAGRPLF